MPDFYAHLVNNVQVRIGLEFGGVLPGVCKHRLVVYATLSPANAQSDAVPVTVSGDVTAQNLGGGSGYLGQLIVSDGVKLRSDVPQQIQLYVELTDEQVRRIEERRNQANGGFDLRLSLRVTGGENWTNTEGTVGIGREDWLNVMRAVGYRRVLIAELEIPDSTARPELQKALEHFHQAQARYSLGDYRAAAVDIRNAIEILLEEPPGTEITPEIVNAELKDALTRARKNDGVDYPERMRIACRAVKLVADTGAHPKADETHRAEALALLHMAAGLMQWFDRK